MLKQLLAAAEAAAQADGGATMYNTVLWIPLSWLKFPAECFGLLGPMSRVGSFVGGSVTLV
jgi:hypothetical protein